MDVWRLLVNYSVVVSIVDGNRSYVIVDVFVQRGVSWWRWDIV